MAKTKSRGFAELCAKTIIKVDETAVNEVVMFDSEGNKWIIGVEVTALGIPILSASKEPWHASA